MYNLTLSWPLYLNNVSFDIKCRVSDFELLFVYPPTHDLVYLGPVSPNYPLKCPNYPKGVSTKKNCHALEIFSIKL